MTASQWTIAATGLARAAGAAPTINILLAAAGAAATNVIFPAASGNSLTLCLSASLPALLPPSLLTLFLSPSLPLFDSIPRTHHSLPRTLRHSSTVFEVVLETNGTLFHLDVN
eukprot:GHVU01161106.1.p1 GENE.GHVU01161106.1~~GHVU01161106.1.p1  ORF type:complete len:113 (+),score=8.32 GHVU01161106.1:860-1198(+)